MPNRRVVTKKRSTALIRQQIEWAVYDMADVTPLPYCAKSRQSLIIFSAMLRLRRGRKPPVDDSVAVYPFARRRNFMHFASHDRIFTIGFLLPSSASSRWFYSEILHNPAFLYKLSINKIIIYQQIKTHTKNKPLRCTYSNEKVVHSEISVYSFGVLTACCATKRGSLTIAQRVGRWFLVIHFLFVTWRVSTVRCDFYCLFALYVGEFELCILKIPFQQSLSSIRP